MDLASIVVSAAVHAEEVRAPFKSALPETLGELFLPMCGFTETHG